MRQSKQLIPMLPASGKDKAKGKHLPSGGSKAPAPAAPEGLGRTRSLPSTKKGEEPPSGPVMMGLGQLQQARRGPAPAERQQQAAGARDNGAGETGSSCRLVFSQVLIHVWLSRGRGQTAPRQSAVGGLCGGAGIRSGRPHLLHFGSGQQAVLCSKQRTAATGSPVPPVHKRCWNKHTVCAHHHSWGHSCTLFKLCLNVCAGAKTLDRERQRMSFFQSLRKGATNGGVSSPQQPDAAVSAPEVAASPVPCKAEAAASEQLKSAEASVPAANGHLSSIQEHSELPNGVAKQESPRRLQQQVRLCPGQATSMLLQLGAWVTLVLVSSSTDLHSLC